MAETQSPTMPSDREQAIIRQAEFYFSDENLPNDAFMLEVTGGSLNKPVSITRICNLPELRQYRPGSLIKSALRKSAFLEFTDNKHIRRRVPLTLQPTVESAVIDDPHSQKDMAVRPGQSLTDLSKPWLTKGMLKPTGFEPYFADAPITPAEYTTERELYDSDMAFETRIETAIQRYLSRRKFHPENKSIFELFLTYGGIDCRARQFTGGLSKEDIDSMDAAEIAAAKANHFVASHVEQSEDWIVDFAGVARGFFAAAGAAVNFPTVLANFYRYLLHHDVCEEYATQIVEALQVCEMAKVELADAIQAAFSLPDLFAKACSVVSGGVFAGLSAGGGTGNLERQLGDTGPGSFAGGLSGEGAWDSGVDLGIDKEQAVGELQAAFSQLATADQSASLTQGLSSASIYITSESDVAMQIIGIELPQEAQTSATSVDGTASKTTSSSRFGKISCRKLVKSLDKPSTDDTMMVTIWMEEEALKLCFVGMKLEVVLCENNIGCRWIERVKSANASYFQVIANDFYGKAQDNILPKEWYKRERTIKQSGYKKNPEMVADEAGSEE
ncbi:hypothetical protein K461DRAFT_232523 [Myriangium duriaei CBS 260.36]|uniref:HTH La-type RNA-binding domain-containing protein n=1 Tax=Myriangium duriaei CBS 260.36 TaxID=1168546 RepID=A0A9P4MIM2_9PEZI|nr:hypothetical protein K461DRAFT_232523 [Myriangium duriaei CBS 260.36]